MCILKKHMYAYKKLISNELFKMNCSQKMFKVDQVKSLFNCDQCSELLVGPVTIDCGNTVCKVHLDQLEGSRPYTCELCRKEHLVPKDGFAISKRIETGLQIELNQLKLSPVFYECESQIREAYRLVTHIEDLERNPEEHIQLFFEVPN